MRVTHFRDLRWPTEWDKWETLLWQQKPLLWNHQASVCCLVAVVALFKQPTSDIEEKKWSGPQNTLDMRQEVAEGRIIMTPNSQLGWPLRVCSKLKIWSTWAGPSRLYTRHFSLFSFSLQDQKLIKSALTGFIYKTKMWIEKVNMGT